MRPTRILPIILLLTACAPAAPVLTATPLPPTVTETFTPMPTMTSTAEPSATPEPTATFTPTSSPTPTEAVPPPKGFSTMADAEKYGWKYAEGIWEQHIVRNEQGEIVFGDLRVEVLDFKYDDHGYMYHFPNINEQNIFPELSYQTMSPDPLIKVVAISILVNNPEAVDNYFTKSGINETEFEVDYDTGEVYRWGMSDPRSPLAWKIYASKGRTDISYGAIGLTMLMEKNKSIKTFKLGSPLSVIYESGE